MQLTIESLRKENQLLRSKANATADNNTISEETSEKVLDDTDSINGPNTEEKSQDDSVESEISKAPSVILPANSTIASISEPVQKLESRFKETMEKVAELTDEKQRLEHLVLQLQGETETIGNFY